MQKWYYRNILNFRDEETIEACLCAEGSYGTSKFGCHRERDRDYVQRIDVKVCVFNIRSCCLPDITSSQNGLIFSMTFSNMETTICLKHDEDSIDDGTTADPLELITPSPINI